MTSAWAGLSSREFGAHGFAHVVNLTAADDAVGTSEVNVLEDAWTRGAMRERTMAFDAVLRDGDDFAVLDFADELSADDVEGAGFGRQHVGAVQAAEDERTNADRVAGADQHVVGHGDESVGAFDLQQRIDEALDHAALS